MNQLSGIRVVEMSTGISGASAAKLFADLGADVVKVEPSGGDPLRRRDATGTDSPLFRYLSGGKRAVLRTDTEDLIAGADLLIESEPAAALDRPALLARHPGLVVLSFTPYGTHGPWADRPASEFVLQAESGGLGLHGHPSEEPYQIGGRLSEFCAGTFGAVGALAALYRARRTGVGEHVDCPLHMAASFSSLAFVDAMSSLLGVPDGAPPARFVDLPSIEPAADGWVGFKVFTRPQFEAFVLLIERPELMTDEWALAPFRAKHIDEWNGYVREWTKTRTVAEIVELAVAMRIPVAAVGGADSVLANEHFRARGLFARAPDGAFEQPLPPYRFDGVRPGIPGPAPAIGEHEGLIEARTRRAPSGACGAGITTGGDGAARPFEGLRVLDLTTMWAGPSFGQLFGYGGAEVVHVESAEHLDGTRTFLVPSQIGKDRWWEQAGAWLSINRNKRSLALSLRDPRGQAAFREVVRTADVIVENYSPRVFDAFGLSAETVRELNPRAVFVRMPAFGLDGPWRDRTGFAQTMEQATGMAWRTGRPEDSPRIPNGPCDPLAGFSAAFAAISALIAREDTGRGAFVEAAMVESALSAAAELVVEYGANGTSLQRTGNRSPDAAPQGIYACQGTEQWLALSVETDEHWKAFTAVLGDPSWAGEPGLADHAGRLAHHDLIDDHVAGWAATQDLSTVVEALVAAGVPAGSVRDPRKMPDHPQLAALGYYEEVDHEVVGPHRMPTIPFRYGSIEKFGTTPAPLLGQHNHEVLRSAGLDEAAIAELESAGLLATRPAGT